MTISGNMVSWWLLGFAALAACSDDKPPCMELCERSKSEGCFSTQFSNDCDRFCAQTRFQVCKVEFDDLYSCALDANAPVCSGTFEAPCPVEYAAALACVNGI